MRWGLSVDESDLKSRLSPAWLLRIPIAAGDRNQRGGTKLNPTGNALLYESVHTSFIVCLPIFQQGKMLQHSTYALHTLPQGVHYYVLRIPSSEGFISWTATSKCSSFVIQGFFLETRILTNKPGLANIVPG